MDIVGAKGLAVDLDRERLERDPSGDLGAQIGGAIRASLLRAGRGLDLEYGNAALAGDVVVSIASGDQIRSLRAASISFFCASLTGSMGARGANIGRP